MAIEIVDLPMNNGDFPYQNVSLPEGNPSNLTYPYPISWKLILIILVLSTRFS